MIELFLPPSGCVLCVVVEMEAQSAERIVPIPGGASCEDRGRGQQWSKRVPLRRQIPAISDGTATFSVSVM